MGKYQISQAIFRKLSSILNPFLYKLGSSISMVFSNFFKFCIFHTIALYQNPLFGTRCSSERLIFWWNQHIYGCHFFFSALFPKNGLVMGGKGNLDTLPKDNWLARQRGFLRAEYRGRGRGYEHTRGSRGARGDKDGHKLFVSYIGQARTPRPKNSQSLYSLKGHLQSLDFLLLRYLRRLIRSLMRWLSLGQMAIRQVTLVSTSYFSIFISSEVSMSG